MIERGAHDVGGLPAGKLDRTEHDHAAWEQRVDALARLLWGPKALMTVDELRKNVEAIGHGDYDKLSYYERWITSITQTLILRGTITTDELGRKMEEIQRRTERACREPSS